MDTLTQLENAMTNITAAESITHHLEPTAVMDVGPFSVVNGSKVTVTSFIA